MAAEPESISTEPQKTSQHDQVVGKSRGSLTKKHAAIDVFGNPVRIILTAGQLYNG